MANAKVLLNSGGRVLLNDGAYFLLLNQSSPPIEGSLIPTGYEPRGLVPIIIISDRDDTEQYRFEHPLAIGSGTPEMNELPVTGYHIHGGIGSDLGRMNLSVDDRNKILTNLNDRRRPGLIKPQWKIDTWLYPANNTGPPAGASKALQSDIAKWFGGFIMDPVMDRPFPNMQTWNLFAVGAGLEYADRLTSIKREQARSANGLDFDDTDTLANASQIADDLINKTDHFPHTGMPAISGFTTDFRAINIKFADFVKRFISIHTALQEIANRTGQIWGIRPHNKQIFMYPRGTRDSGLLITNDYTSLLTGGFDKTKLCLGRKNPFGYVDSSAGFGYSFLHGVGGLTDFLMLEDPNADASLNLSAGDAQFAFPFIPTQDSISKISIFADLASSTSTPLVMSIVGNDTSGPKPSDDIRRRVDVQPDRLNQKISASGNWFEQAYQTINMGTRVRPGDTYYLVIDAHPLLRVDYDSAIGTFFRNSGTIAAPIWGTDIGKLKLRVHHSHSINVIVENTVARKSFGYREMAIPLNDFPNEESATTALVGFSSVVGKARRIYKPIQVTPPQSVPLLGMTARLIDKFNGMDTFVDLTGFDIQATSFSKWNRGVDSMTLHMEEVYYP